MTDNLETLTDFERNLASMPGAQLIVDRGSRTGQPILRAVRIGSAVLPWAGASASGTREAQLMAAQARVVGELHQQLEAIASDTTRSESWKHQQRELVSTRAAAQLESEASRARDVVESFVLADQREAVPVQLEPGDAAGAVRDAEIRRFIFGLEGDLAVAFAGRLSEPGMEAVVAALLRSPIPLDVASEFGEMWRRLAVSAWVDHQTRANPELYRQRTEARERTEWLRQVTDSLSAVMAHMRRLDTAAPLPAHLAKQAAPAVNLGAT